MYFKKGQRSAWFENGFAGIEIQIFCSELIFCNDNMLNLDRLHIIMVCSL